FPHLFRNCILYLLPEARARTLGQPCAHTFHQTSGGINQLGPCCHQCLPRSQHHQILTHLSTAVSDRVQRLWIHPPQPGQLLGIDPIILALSPFRPLHQPRVGHHHLVSLPREDFLHPGRVRPHFHHHPRRR